MKTVLFVPGFGEDVDDFRDYRKVMLAIEKRGYHVRFVPIRWKRTTINQWVAELGKVYKEFDPAHTILAGFSLGAVTTFVAASKRPPAELWLLSLSPYFDDDPELTHPFPNTWDLGKRRLAAFDSLDYPKMVQNISSKTVIFYGQTEGEKFPDLERRCELAAKHLSNAKLVRIPKTDHAVEDPRYIQAITDNI